MIQGIHESTPDANMICPRAISKVTSQDYVGQNDRQTRGTATTNTDTHGGTCTDDRGSLCTDKQTHISTSTDDHESTCADSQGSTRTDVYTESMGVSTESKGVQGSTFPEISTKGTGVNEGFSMNVSMGKTILCGRMCTYDEYRMHGPGQDIGTDTVGKV